MMDENLIDSFIISIIPIFLGNGVKLFRDKRPELKMQLKKSVSYPSGLVQLWHQKNESHPI
jgi:dihydrofolate reductase